MNTRLKGRKKKNQKNDRQMAKINCKHGKVFKSEDGEHYYCHDCDNYVKKRHEITGSNKEEQFLITLIFINIFVAFSSSFFKNSEFAIFGIFYFLIFLLYYIYKYHYGEFVGWKVVKK